jgi:hypothetical protein
MQRSLSVCAFLVALALSASCSSTRSAGTAAAVEQADADVNAADRDANVEASLDEVATGCRVVLPPCPDPAPSYVNDVAPILDAKCNTCHVPELGRPWPLTNYADVHDWSYSILSDIARCTMPPVDAGTPALTAAEEIAVLGWVICGAPDN